MLQDIYSYIDDIKVRHHIYQVWAAPVLEFFMLQQVMHRSIHSSELERLQHNLLTTICKLSTRGTSKIDINMEFKELNIQQKVARFATAVSNLPSIQKLIQEDRIEEIKFIQEGTFLRSNVDQPTEFNITYNESNSLPIRLDTLRKSFIDEHNKDIGKLKAQKMDYKHLKKWIKKVKLRQRRFANSIGFAT